MRVTLLLTLVAVLTYLVLAYINHQALVSPWTGFIIGAACGVSALIGDLFSE